MFWSFFQRFFRRQLPAGKEPAAQLPPAPPVSEIEPLLIITPPPAEVPNPTTAVERAIEDQTEDRRVEVTLAEPKEPVPLPPPSPLPALPPQPPTIVVYGNRAAYFAPVRGSAISAPAHRLIAPDLAARALKPRALRPAPKIELPQTTEVPVIDVTAVTMEPLSLFATGSGNPFAPAGSVRSIDPGLFTCLIANREGSPRVPPQAVQEYLADPPLLNHALELRTRVLHRYASAEPPLSHTDFYELSYSLAGHTSTALLLCHNVAKSFARGSRLIYWQVVDRARDEFSDGEQLYSGRHLFFALFSAARDAGDWYRFFAHAALASFTSRGETRFPAPLAQRDAADLARRHERLAEQFPGTADSPQSKAALWSNTFSFWEAGCFARTLSRSTELIRVSRDACRFANRVNGITAGAPHSWRIPKPGGLQGDFNLDKATASQLTAEG